MLAGRCRADHTRSDVLRDLRRGDANPAPHWRDEDGLAGSERPHDHDKLPAGQLIHWNCGALEGRQSGRSREDSLHRHANHVGISAKAGHGDYVFADPALVDARGDSVDSTADFVARHNRNGRQIGIYAHAPHDVGKIDPARLDTDADLSRVRRRINGFFNFQYLWRPSACNPNLSHDNNSLAWAHLNLRAAFGYKHYSQSGDF